MALSDKYYTATEAANELGVTRQTVHRWVKDGTLEAEKVGGNILIEQEEVLRFQQDRMKRLYFESFNWYQARNGFSGIKQILGFADEDKIELLGDPTNPEYLVTFGSGEKAILTINHLGMDFNKKTGKFQSSMSPKDVTISDFKESKKHSK